MDTWKSHHLPQRHLSCDVSSVPRAASQRWPRAKGCPKCPLPPICSHICSVTRLYQLSCVFCIKDSPKGLCKVFSIFFAAQRKKSKDIFLMALARGLSRVPHWPEDDRCYLSPCVLGRLLWPVPAKLAKQGELPRQTTEVWELTAPAHCGVKRTHETRHQGCCLE